MNIAFPALLIAILILPGIVFRYTYARGSWGWTSPISFRSVSDELAYSAIFAVGLHFFWLVLSHLFGFSADFGSLIALLTGNFGVRGERYESSLASISQYALPIALYFLSLLGIAACAGRLSHSLVRKAKWDHNTQIFRFKNEWYYLLTGEVLSFKENSMPIRQIDGVLLSAVVEHGKECFLYRGIVEDWSFDNDGRLDNFRLRFTYRRSLKDDRASAAQTGEYVPPDDRYYEVRGDLFILRYSEVKTVNLDYFSLTDEEWDDDGSVGLLPSELATNSPGQSNSKGV